MARKFYGKYPHLIHRRIENQKANIAHRQYLVENPDRAEAIEWQNNSHRKLTELSEIIGKEEANKANLAYFDTFEMPIDYKHYYEYLEALCVGEERGELWHLGQQELRLEQEMI